MTDRDVDYEELVDQLEAAGLLERYDEDGQPAVRLTERGRQVGLELAMSADETTLDALLDAVEDDTDDG